ncbi:ProQ activator of osmoprotectant transporter ProP [Nitrosococcus halophilus Nc 4]|uniref:ProQ activator of osmoprotectant transporter ProP n=1 Tax=Nitrosococcus halophilus (strain Nc4) TaxID=472759 RepID=D5BV00_NITHN|nr:ProQ/FinO family protein [Nitrosococcus halophilus]ADE15350.1 ProQ activator of osmoprotectant transporter ProP [Nitrosococcus halophilus Nc 4]
MRPLAVGVHQELIPFATERGFSKLALRRALGMHMNCTPYLYALAERRGRVSLDGEEVEKPTEEHAEHARQKLKARFEARKQKRANEPPKKSNTAKVTPIQRETPPKRPILSLKRAKGLSKNAV